LATVIGQLARYERQVTGGVIAMLGMTRLVDKKVMHLRRRHEEELAG
jgi:hypothetical protein